MSSRIRYKVEDNALVSLRIFKSASGLREYQLRIIPENDTFVVYYVTNGSTVACATTKSLAAAKKKAKDALASMGVLFESETRKVVTGGLALTGVE